MKRKLGFLVLCMCTIFLFILISTEHRKIDNDTMENSQKIDKKVFLNLKYNYEPKCGDHALLVLLVTSSAQNFETRDYLRRSYSNEELSSLRVKRIFLLGESLEKTTQEHMDQEHTQHKDLLQGSFKDSYGNLTIKHLMGLQWASINCNAKFLAKMDDDIVVDLYEVLSLVQSGIIEENSLSGYVLSRMRVVRDPASKWFVSPQEYGPESYPDFLSGWFYMATLSTIKKLPQRAMKSNESFFWIDDVFVTGILRRESDFGLKPLNRFYATDYRFLDCCLRGRSRKLACDFFAGPDGGRKELQLEFKDFVQFCNTNCMHRAKGLSVLKTCVAAYTEINRPGNGTAKIYALRHI